VTVPLDQLGLGKERDLYPQRLAVDGADQELGSELSRRVELVGDVRGVRERRGGQIDRSAARATGRFPMRASEG
jgi:hypothetical protein